MVSDYNGDEDGVFRGGLWQIAIHIEMFFKGTKKSLNTFLDKMFDKWGWI